MVENVQVKGDAGRLHTEVHQLHVFVVFGRHQSAERVTVNKTNAAAPASASWQVVYSLGTY